MNCALKGELVSREQVRKEGYAIGRLARDLIAAMASRLSPTQIGLDGEAMYKALEVEATAIIGDLVNALATAGQPRNERRERASA